MPAAPARKKDRRFMMPLHLLIVGRKHVEFRCLPQAREDGTMENSLKRKLADDALTFCLGDSAGIAPIVRLGARYLTARNDMQYLMKTLPVPRQ
jgi:hypothetical protein